MFGWTNSIRQEILSAGFSVEKCDKGYWHLLLEGVSMLSANQLGTLLRNAAKELKID